MTYENEFRTWTRLQGTLWDVGLDKGLWVLENGSKDTCNSQQLWPGACCFALLDHVSWVLFGGLLSGFLWICTVCGISQRLRTGSTLGYGSWC